DGTRRVFVHTQRLRYGRERRAARLAELERAVDILREENAFDGDLLRRMQRDQLRDPRVNDAQPVGQRAAGGGDAALRHDPQLAAIAIDDAETGAQRAGVQPQYSRRSARRNTGRRTPGDE